MVQQMTSLRSQRAALIRVLSTFCGMEIKAPVKPDNPDMLDKLDKLDNRHPELRLIDAQLRLADSQAKALDAAMKPRLGVFAQGFYGYPGYNMFEDMMSRKLSWNGMIGAKLTWNIGALYTRKNDKGKIQLQRESAEVSRAHFLFENKIVTAKVYPTMTAAQSKISTLFLYNKHLNYKVFMIPALFAMVMMLMCGFPPTLNIMGVWAIGSYRTNH